MAAVESHTVRIVSWTVISLVIICVALIFFQLIYGLLFDHHKKKGKAISSFHIYGAIACIFYLVSLIIFLINNIYYVSWLWEGNGYAILEMTWSLAHVFTYLVYINRLNVVFNASAINSSQIHYKIFYLLIILFFLCELSVTILDFTKDKLRSNVYVLSLLILYVIDICVDLTMTTSIVYLFAKKLFIVILQFTYMSRSRHHDNAPNISPYNVNYDEDDASSEITEESEILNMSQQKLLSVVIKHTNLSIIGIVSTQLYILWGVIFSIIVVIPTIKNDSYTQLNAYLTSSYLLLNDCLMNSLSISLNFTFSGHIYNKLCCFCHIGFKNCCLKLAKKRLRYPSEMKYIHK